MVGNNKNDKNLLFKPVVITGVIPYAYVSNAEKKSRLLNLNTEIWGWKY